MITTKNTSINGLISYNYNTEIEGTNLLIIANIHGNEVCGTHAIHTICNKLQSGELPLEKGQVTLLPSCNPTAHIDNVRAVNVDMNRIVGKTETIDPRFYEVALAKELENLIQQCDVLLSIHACSAETVPFAIRDWDTDGKMNEWSHKIGCDYVVTGWENIHPSAGDTASFAKAHGKRSLTIECGTIGKKENVAVAERAIEHSLAFWKLTKQQESEKEASKQVTEVEMKKEIIRPENSASELAKKRPCNLEAFSKGETLATANSEVYAKAPFDGVYIMPDTKAAPGESWFYIAEVK